MPTAPATGPAYRLVRPPVPPVVPPVLDPAQQAVVDHPGGPLLVLAGPGTGKTTTMVEAVVARVERGLRPEQVLVLTFSRKAADELRERITARLGRTVAGPSAWTFHSWCFALVSAYAEDRGTPRLLSGPERLVRIRELLQGDALGEGSTRWPSALRPALATRGMARELADLLDRARERGVEPDDLRRLAMQTARDDWRAAADFYDEYLAVLGGSGEMDYGELVRRALRLLDDPDVAAEVRARYRAVFVDEYQDTDPAQEELLRVLAGGGGDLVVVGDPDQAIYGFRGADVSCLLGFPERFRRSDDAPAPTLTLATSRRAGQELLRVSREVARRLTAPGLPVELLRRHRALAPGRDEPGFAEVRVFGTVGDEVTAIADLLRRAHLEQGRPWREMAVLVRSGLRSLPVLRRALVAAGVPVVTAADEVPVAHDPAVAPLLLALRCAADPSALDADVVRTLLTSPLVRATPADLRRLGRALRAGERAAAADEASEALRLPPPSAELLRRAVARPGDLLLLDERDAWPAQRLVDLLARAREVLGRGGGAEEALWSLWDGCRGERRLLAQIASGGQPARAAERDLDAIVALFDAVARLEERQPRVGVRALLDELEAQEIPSESRREGVLAGGDAVRLLTAHRSKGLEWDLVVVAGAQDGVWPDLRRRASLLEGDRLGRDEVQPAPTPGQLLVDERRLFYVAVTRARERLVVTAVRSADDDGERPSRFLAELGVPVPEQVERPAALLSAASVTGRLRRAAVDPATSDAERGAVVALLARLAAPRPDGAGPRVPAAHPDRWWGLHEPSPGVHPVRPPDEPVRLSGSAVAAYDTCPLAWFLDREAHAATASTTAQGFGLVLHALARLVATGALPPEIEPILARLDEVWHALGFDAAWQSARERREAEAALRRFLVWHLGRDRTWVASEASFVLEHAGMLLRGSLDRVERDADGRLVVVDFKTGRQAPANQDVAEHAQLGVYQVVVREGGLTDALGGAAAELGGAELVHLRLDTRTGEPKVQRQQPLVPDDDGLTWADRLLRRTAAGIVAEEFPARLNDGCDRCAFRHSCPARDEGGQVVR